MKTFHKIKKYEIKFKKIAKFSRIGSLSHFLTHGRPMGALHARELRYYCLMHPVK